MKRKIVSENVSAEKDRKEGLAVLIAINQNAGPFFHT